MLLGLGLLCIALYILGLIFQKLQHILAISDAIAGLLILGCWVALNIQQLFRDSQRDETQKLFIAASDTQNCNNSK